MILYFSIILIVATIIAVLNILLTSYIWWVIVLLVVSATLLQFVFDGLFALIVNRLPDKWFSMNKKCFQVAKREQRVYEKLGIRKWKDRVWELGGLGGFRKNKLLKPNSPEYIEKFIVESNKGIVTHIIGCFAGFLAIFILPFKFILPICIPVALTNLFLNILPVMILRYNVPKLTLLHKRLERNQQLNNE